MKKLKLFLVICSIVFSAGCDDDDAYPDNGELSVKLRTWNNFETANTKSVSANLSDPTLLQFVDVKGYKYEMKVTTDDITEGVKDSEIEWITIYESEELKDDSERDFQFELPVGDYKGFALLQGRDFFWIAEHDGEIIEIPTSNGGSSDTIYNVFGVDGLYVLNSSDELTKVNNEEKLGVDFKIEEGKTTLLTIRINFKEIWWYDNDGDGNWSIGDMADDPLLPEGVTTMADFIVVYNSFGD